MHGGRRDRRPSRDGRPCPFYRLLLDRRDRTRGSRGAGAAGAARAWGPAPGAAAGAAAATGPAPSRRLAGTSPAGTGRGPAAGVGERLQLPRSHQGRSISSLVIDFSGAWPWACGARRCARGGPPPGARRRGRRGHRRQRATTATPENRGVRRRGRIAPGPTRRRRGRRGRRPRGWPGEFPPMTCSRRPRAVAKLAPPSTPAAGVSLSIRCWPGGSDGCPRSRTGPTVRSVRRKWAAARAIAGESATRTRSEPLELEARLRTASCSTTPVLPMTELTARNRRAIRQGMNRGSSVAGPAGGAASGVGAAAGELGGAAGGRGNGTLVAVIGPAGLPSARSHLHAARP